MTKIKGTYGIFVNEELVAARIMKELIQIFCNNCKHFDNQILEIWSMLLISPILTNYQDKIILEHLKQILKLEIEKLFENNNDYLNKLSTIFQVLIKTK